ncbi:hypothetical protein HEP_00324900 [Hepatocystis sp. ex Piliocolobus tephrosceles]|nr:hypothetical protein HEP_00324900 [Hepatocystis sp. ex Piliocolobus tephrosceles]
MVRDIIIKHISTREIELGDVKEFSKTKKKELTCIVNKLNGHTNPSFNLRRSKRLKTKVVNDGSDVDNKTKKYLRMVIEVILNFIKHANDQKNSKLIGIKNVDKDEYNYKMGVNIRGQISVNDMKEYIKRLLLELNTKYAPDSNLIKFYEEENKDDNKLKNFTYTICNNSEVQEKARLVFITYEHPLYSHKITHNSITKNCNYYYKQYKCFIWTDAQTNINDSVKTSNILDQIPNMKVIYLGTTIPICCALNITTNIYFFFYIYKENKNSVKTINKLKKHQFIYLYHIFSINRNDFFYNNVLYNNITFNTDVHKPNIILSNGMNEPFFIKLKVIFLDIHNRILFLFPIYDYKKKYKIKIIPNVLFYSTLKMGKNTILPENYWYSIINVINKKTNKDYLEIKTKYINKNISVINTTQNKKKISRLLKKMFNEFEQCINKKYEINSFEEENNIQNKKDNIEYKYSPLNMHPLDLNELLVILNKENGILQLYSDDIYICDLSFPNSAENIFNINNNEKEIFTIEYDINKVILRSYELSCFSIDQYNDTIKLIFSCIYNTCEQKIHIEFLKFILMECTYKDQQEFIDLGINCCGLGCSCSYVNNIYNNKYISHIHFCKFLNGCIFLFSNNIDIYKKLFSLLFKKKINDNNQIKKIMCKYHTKYNNLFHNKEKIIFYIKKFFEDIESKEILPLIIKDEFILFIIILSICQNDYSDSMLYFNKLTDSMRKLFEPIATFIIEQAYEENRLHEMNGEMSETTNVSNKKNLLELLSDSCVNFMVNNSINNKIINNKNNIMELIDYLISFIGDDKIEFNKHIDECINRYICLQNIVCSSVKLNITDECKLKELELLHSIAMKERKLNSMTSINYTSSDNNDTNNDDDHQEVSNYIDNVFQKVKNDILINDHLTVLYNFKPIFFPFNLLYFLNILNIMNCDAKENEKKIYDILYNNISKNKLNIIYLPDPCVNINLFETTYSDIDNNDNKRNENGYVNKINHDNMSNDYTLDKNKYSKEDIKYKLYTIQRNSYSRTLKYFLSLNLGYGSLFNILLKSIFSENIYCVIKYSDLMRCNKFSEHKMLYSVDKEREMEDMFDILAYESNIYEDLKHLNAYVLKKVIKEDDEQVVKDTDKLVDELITKFNIFYNDIEKEHYDLTGLWDLLTEIARKYETMQYIYTILSLSYIGRMHMSLYEQVMKISQLNNMTIDNVEKFLEHINKIKIEYELKNFNSATNILNKFKEIIISSHGILNSKKSALLYVLNGIYEYMIHCDHYRRLYLILYNRFDNDLNYFLDDVTYNFNQLKENSILEKNMTMYINEEKENKIYDIKNINRRKRQDGIILTQTYNLFLKYLYYNVKSVKYLKDIMVQLNYDHMSYCRMVDAHMGNNFNLIHYFLDIYENFYEFFDLFKNANIGSYGDKSIDISTINDVSSNLNEDNFFNRLKNKNIIIKENENSILGKNKNELVAGKHKLDSVDSNNLLSSSSFCSNLGSENVENHISTVNFKIRKCIMNNKEDSNNYSNETNMKNDSDASPNNIVLNNSSTYNFDTLSRIYNNKLVYFKILKKLHTGKHTRKSLFKYLTFFKDDKYFFSFFKKNENIIIKILAEYYTKGYTNIFVYFIEDSLRQNISYYLIQILIKYWNLPTYSNFWKIVLGEEEEKNFIFSFKVDYKKYLYSTNDSCFLIPIIEAFDEEINSTNYLDHLDKMYDDNDYEWYILENIYKYMGKNTINKLYKNTNLKATDKCLYTFLYFKMSLDATKQIAKKLIEINNITFNVENFIIFFKNLLFSYIIGNI